MSLLRNLTTAAAVFGTLRFGLLPLIPALNPLGKMEPVAQSLFMAGGITALSYFALAFRYISAGTDDDVRFVLWVGAVACAAQVARLQLYPAKFPNSSLYTLVGTSATLATIATFA